MVKMVLDNIMVLPDPQQSETVTSSGLIIKSITDVQQQKSGVVVSVGEGTYQFGQWITLHIKEGDKVVYKASTGYPFIHEGVEYTILKEPDIIAVVNDNN